MVVTAHSVPDAGLEPAPETSPSPTGKAIGANTWIWVSPLTDERLAGLAPRIKGWGFDVVELPIEDTTDWDPGRTADLLAGLGLGATTCAVMPESRDLVTADQAVVTSTQGYLRTCVDHAARVGADVVAGPIYAPVGRTWLMEPGERGPTLARLVERLAPVAEYAAAKGVRLAIEPLNRYETSLINTLAQAVEVADRLASPGCGVAADTFHMNIEEKDMTAALREAGPWLAHVQVCGNDRGAPGDDHIDWAAMAAALDRAGYSGPVCIESFTSENQTIARAASIWRPLAPSQDELATRGLAHLRDVFGPRS
ncbi:MAG: sugar phosphate isomerase/epimerase family protein [Candidatus Limnocylindrales bacterium]